MARTEDGSIRIAKAADAAAMAIIHVESWRETYTGIVPDDVLTGLSVDQRTATWHRILCDPTTFYSSAVFVAEPEGGHLRIRLLRLAEIRNVEGLRRRGQFHLHFALLSTSRF